MAICLFLNYNTKIINLYCPNIGKHKLIHQKKNSLLNK